ncbi:MAG TPA: L-threonylcarbamoyladenylate synthase [Candidatus Polarisedimenticolia bacterium]|nr:L-threonylcarbamoyladenylate synthase [Candidatus Polarisedimenticolia bacterium]
MSPPRLLQVDPVHPEPEPLAEATRIIRQGGLVAYPTETFYGLGADPFSRVALERLFAAKGRPADRSVILLVSSIRQVEVVATVPEGARPAYEKLAAAFWPGPLTLVLRACDELAREASAPQPTVAVRVPGHPIALGLAAACGPITSTSANLTGGAPATRASEIDPVLAGRLDLIVDGGPTRGGAPSTIVDLTGARPTLIRAGSIASAQIGALLGHAL